jgi:hypothetical protein
MKYDLYFQKFGETLATDYVNAAYEGFLHRNDADYKAFFFDEIEEVPHKDNVIVFGFIEDCVKWLKDMNIDVPKPISYPECLQQFMQRNFKITTLGEFKHEEKTKYPIFVKPFDQLKLFPGGVISSDFSKRNFFDFPDEIKIITSEYLDILSEYRCFVNHGELIGIKHYQGEFNIFPNMEKIHKMIETYHKEERPPCSYTLDIGIINFSDIKITILIEVNDGWCCGSYGLDGELVLKFHMQRWLEMMRKNKIN